EEEESCSAHYSTRGPVRLVRCVTSAGEGLISLSCSLQKHAAGHELFMKVCDHLNLLEKDYYGLAIWETPTMKVRPQPPSFFTFNVKFYPPDPAQLSEDITRYLMSSSGFLRKDILQGRLPCSFVTLALLGSYALQSELGEYDPEVHASGYAKDMKMAQGQTKELEDKMMELHHTYRSEQFLSEAVVEDTFRFKVYHVTQSRESVKQFYYKSTNTAILHKYINVIQNVIKYLALIAKRHFNYFI
uniref:FERM domain-containing protein n=1 Tax=Seriola lalandi dorsalis TaxID=1841481 RepID=A0A3B4WNX2_SERLL